MRITSIAVALLVAPAPAIELEVSKVEQMTGDTTGVGYDDIKGSIKD